MMLRIKIVGKILKLLRIKNMHVFVNEPTATLTLLEGNLNALNLSRIQLRKCF